MLAQVMFTTADPTPALVSQIEASGEIVVVTMWAGRQNFDQGEYAARPSLGPRGLGPAVRSLDGGASLRS